MNDHFTSYIAQGRALASSKGLTWEPVTDQAGRVERNSAWNLTALVGDSPPPTHRLADFSPHERAAEILAAVFAVELPVGADGGLLGISKHWRDLIQTIALDQLLLRHNSTQHVYGNVVPPLRVFATCAWPHEPWELTVDDAKRAVDVAARVQASGKLADLVFGLVQTVFDALRLSNNVPLSPFLQLDRAKRNKTARYLKSTEQIRAALEERKEAEKLPERRALWEMVRIVFTEQPRSFLDNLRFAQAKVILLTGLRVGEPAVLPLDWKRFTDHYDKSGLPAGDVGGISQSLSLRYIAEKAGDEGGNSISRRFDLQAVPSMFEKILIDTLDDVARITEPLRRRLRTQVTTGRVLTDYEPNDRVQAALLYPALTGNPFFCAGFEDRLSALLDRYRRDFDPTLFDSIYREQLSAFRNGAMLSGAAYQFLSRFQGAPYREFDGRIWTGRKKWREVYLEIEEVEALLRSSLPTKQSDVTPLRVMGGDVNIPDLLFLMPKRAVAEGRDGLMCDVLRYLAVGRMDASMMTGWLSNKVPGQGIFGVYGQSDEDRGLSLNPHSLRHLQNTELFRLGVADTIITKRYGRRSLAQSHEYDHRSLAEELDSIDLPADVDAELGPKAGTVARMILAGRASGPIVDSFRTIQRTDGDAAAFSFLKAEADGFHSTPYGHCINSFTVDPCPKHLECFAGCRHLTATNLPENRHHLVTLEGRLAAALEAIEKRKSKSIGRENQLRHATQRLDGVRKLLATPDGHRPFPSGPDLFQRGIGPSSALD